MLEGPLPHLNPPPPPTEPLCTTATPQRRGEWSATAPPSLARASFNDNNKRYPDLDIRLQHINPTQPWGEPLCTTAHMSRIDVWIAAGSNVEMRALNFQAKLNFERGISPSHLASKLNPHFGRQPAATNPQGGSNSYPFNPILSFGSQRIALGSIGRGEGQLRELAIN